MDRNGNRAHSIANTQRDQNRIDDELAFACDIKNELHLKIESKTTIIKLKREDKNREELRRRKKKLKIKIKNEIDRNDALAHTPARFVRDAKAKRRTERNKSQIYYIKKIYIQRVAECICNARI